MSDVHHYRAFGLLFRSDIALPELAAAPIGEPDVRIRRAVFDRPWPETGSPHEYEFGEREHYLCFVGYSRYVLRDGRQIDVEVHPGFQEHLIGYQMLGPVMALLLHMRGLLTLHRSALRVGNGAAIFLGHKGAGKSTTAAAMGAAGHALITDDVVAIDDAGALFPAYPTVKITDEALDSFDPARFELVPTDLPGLVKKRARLRGAFSTEPVIPTHAFVLERGSEASIEPLSPAESLRALLTFSYATRFGDRLINGAVAREHLRQCAALAGRIRVAKLIVPASLHRIPEAVTCVEAAVG